MAGTKIERLLGIIFLLINREKMTAKELADFFSVSIKTIYRDIETLSLANIPVISYSGVNGGYGIMREYIIDKNMFSHQEIVSALSVLGSISSFFSDPGLSIVSEKMVSLVAADTKDNLKRQAEEMKFDLSSWGDGEPTKRKLNNIRQAIQNHNLLSFNYSNREGESLQRIVEPINVFFKERAWYLKGYCRIREDVRTFKLTRMANLLVSEEIYEPDINKYDSEKIKKYTINSCSFVTVTMKISPDVRVRMEDYVDADRVYEENGTLYAKVHYPDEEYLYNTILGFGDKVEVIEPPYVRHAIKERAQKVCELYSKR